MKCMMRIAMLFFAMFALGGAAALGEEKPSPGQADLDEATKLKIAARSFEDLSKVIDRCEKAIKAGLTDKNREFAEQLLVATVGCGCEIAGR